jgi:hypothetical protein
MPQNFHELKIHIPDDSETDGMQTLSNGYRFDVCRIKNDAHSEL